jgi:hypothetical protein
MDIGLQTWEGSMKRLLAIAAFVFRFVLQTVDVSAQAW